MGLMREKANDMGRVLTMVGGMGRVMMMLEEDI